MSFSSIVRDLRDGLGSLSRRGFEVRLSGHHRGKSQGAVHEVHDQPVVIQNSCWASLPPELLRDVIKRLEESENTWPSRKNVVACAAVCRSWREMCKEIVRSPEFCGKLTFPLSLKQPGPRDGTIQCFIKRDKSTLTYHLYLCLSPVLVENGKFLLSAKRTRRTTCTEYIISMDADNISRSSNTYIGKLRSNFLGTKFLIYDTQPAHNGAALSQPGKTSKRFYSKKVSPKVPSGSYVIAQVTYELNVLGTRGPRRMHCIMHSIPASALDAGGTVPGQPDHLLPRSLDDSFGSMSFSKSSIMDRSMDFSSSRFCDIAGGPRGIGDEEDEAKERPLILRNKAPRWHEQLQCWCLNFRGRVTVASVKNFQLIAATQPAAGAPTPSQPAPPEHDKILLQFGKVAKDMFTMDFRYPLSAFQAFAICLSSFDTKLACE
ncbi:tubby-like F-box protein 8 isoform X2 [Phoenix dactylifera]|uniref:Tubby-like F-box protein n=1 Tax=Phoenix dactylifera TaxID=42345 RepID=A0A8B7BRY4_PHODC|nr:tubby-like F-box protein 8 isoform X2 [Phoenix dactylifera]